MALSEKDLSEGQGCPPDQMGEDREFLDYVLILFRYRWLIFWMVILCTAGIVTYASIQEPEFQATAAIYSEQPTYSTSFLSGNAMRKNLLRKLYQYKQDGKTHIINLTETLGAGSEKQALLSLRGMIFLRPDNQNETSIVVTSRSLQLSVVVANACVVQILQNQYDNLKRRRRLLSAVTPKNLVKIREIDFVTNEFEKLQMKMDKVGAEVFQDFRVGVIEVRSLAVPTAALVERYGMNVVVAAGLAVGVCLSVLLVFLFEYGRRKPRLLASLTNELRKDVEWVSSRLGKK